MSEQSTPEEIEEIEEIDDPEELIQTRRIRDIFDARKQVRSERQRAKELKLLDRERRSVTYPEQLYRQSVESYLSELRPLFLDSNLGKTYWFDFDFGQIDVNPPIYQHKEGYNSAPWADKDGESYIVDRIPQSKTVELDGLSYLFRLSDPIEITWNLTGRTPTTQLGTGGSRAQIEKSSYVHISFDRLDAVLNAANTYLAERGIELKPEEGLPNDELQL